MRFRVEEPKRSIKATTAKSRHVTLIYWRYSKLTDLKKTVCELKWSWNNENADVISKYSVWLTCSLYSQNECQIILQKYVRKMCWGLVPIVLGSNFQSFLSLRLPYLLIRAILNSPFCVNTSYWASNYSAGQSIMIPYRAAKPFSAGLKEPFKLHRRLVPE